MDAKNLCGLRKWPYKNDGRKIYEKLLNTKAPSLAQEVPLPQIDGV